jgi:hypothetical protein
MRMSNSLDEPRTAQLLQMIKGFWISQIVGTLARLKIADRLAQEPLSCDVLAARIECHPGSTFRLLRASIHVGLIAALPDGRFGLTPLGELLRSDVRGSLRNHAMAHTAHGCWAPWGRLTEAVRSGERQAIAALGYELFDYYAAHSSEGHAFTAAMGDLSAAIAHVVASVVDTSAVRHAIDIGGASGMIVAALLQKNPRMRGTILERTEVVPNARDALAERGLSARCEVIAGDFFKHVPEADLHILKHILHDWSDEQSVTILRNCASALNPKGRIILIEWLLQEKARPGPAALSDLNMLVLLPGRERSAAQLVQLLQAAALRLERITEIASSLYVLEASPAAVGNAAT